MSEPAPSPSRVPAARYTDPDQARQEWASLWPRVWLMAGLSRDLALVGAWRVFEHGHASILVVRGGDGTLRAFHNVCQHRGALLCTGREGRSERFVCPYHGWRWGSDGTLLGASDAEGFDAEVQARSLRLAELPCDEALGFVWIHLGQPEQSLADYLGPVLPQVAAYGIADWDLRRDSTVPLACNWKTSLDAHAESYHVHALHAEVLPLLDDTAVELCSLGRHSRLRVPFGLPSGRLPEGARPALLSEVLRGYGVDVDALPPGRQAGRLALQALRRARGAAYDALPDVLLSDNQLFHVFPNLHINLHADELQVFRHRPHGSDPGRMFFDQLILQRRPAGQGPAARPPHEDLARAAASLGPLTDADMAIAERVQRGLADGALPFLRLGAGEGGILHYHRVLEELLEQR